MEQLLDTGARDSLSEMLRAVRVRSTVYCRSVMGAPWGFGVEAHGSPAFHIVTSGTCWLEVEEEAGQIELGGGDLVVLPTGRRHWLRDDPATPAPELEEILEENPPDERRRLWHGGRGARTELTCGGFALEGPGAGPIMRALPTFILIRGNAGRPVPWVTGLIAMLAAAISSDAPGGEAVVNRLAEALLAQVLRSALAEQESRLEVRAWPPHPQIAAAIELIHRDPAHSWTVGVLAEEVGFSRSVFAARFRALVGESPKRYITRCRLAHAATLLDTTTLTLAEIARSAGYETEFSLSKAFRREFGLAPGAYRAQSEPARPPLAVST